MIARLGKGNDRNRGDGMDFEKIDQHQASLLTAEIKRRLKRANYDNISRTNAYFHYYLRNPEIQWSLLASMVSRNAGYNMTDLHSSCYVAALDERLRRELFLTYEDANWLIFSDAFPQLLIYEYSKIMDCPLFPLLKAFSVSPFMIREWQMFWESQDIERILTSLIINEQHLIHRPVIHHPVFRREVFTSFVYRFQDVFHFSTVLFPTLKGELFGYSVYNFKRKASRIELGKKLAWLLFQSRWKDDFLLFASSVPHTGSRFDYEKYFPDKRIRQTPILRMAFPAIPHHIDASKRNWFHGQNLNKYYSAPVIRGRSELTDWHRKKRNQMKLISSLKEFWEVQKKTGK
ncbi:MULTISPECIES: DUF2515 family protein [Bacillaceae]|uniref:DUF2515 family protein n=1 Tax=Metabacillus sediminis TaxID=3117746 RepID=A0ABZ2NC18_9BACI|nr:DUF2515 family protein [Bacillus sp. SJS]KZZ86374.1 hypothetical protein AS29_000135 [Bacillus sp. SJS]